MHSLPDLAYGHDALEPYIDTQTMQIHHGKHHQAYVNNLNNALEAYSDLQEKSVEDLLRSLDGVPEAIRTAVRNNAGGHANHSLFWTLMSPGGVEAPTGDLADAIVDAFGSVAALKAEVSKAAAGRFGSGWGWLVVTAGGALSVYSTPNQDSPFMQGDTPILGVDVWEHAYYLKYQNRRPEYLENWWNVVNWDVVASNFAAGR
jgi:Fe-Mn family superoxide dismutase